MGFDDLKHTVIKFKVSLLNFVSKLFLSFETVVGKHVWSVKK